MRSIRLRAFVALLPFAVVSCGGGGGGTGGGGSGGGGGSQGSSGALPFLITASAIVDINGDGKNDVIIGSQHAGHASPIVLFNQGGSFTRSTTAIPAQYLGADGSAIVIEPGDFNKDGKLDLLVASTDVRAASFYQSARIHLYKGNGDGTFTDASADIANGAWPFTMTCPFFNRSALWPADLRIVDIDGDGFLDFVATSSGDGCGGVIYRNDGTAKFAPVNIALTGGTTTVSRPALMFGEAAFPAGANYWAVEVLVGDLNNDGKPDLFAPSQFGGPEHAAFINTSTPGNVSFTIVYSPFGSDGRFKTGVLLDIDGDNNLDVLGMPVHSGSTAAIPVVAFRGNGDGRFTQNNALLSPQPSVVHVRQVLAADVSGDGKADVLISDHGFDAGTFPGARNWLLINNGAGVLADRTATNLDLLPGYTHQSSIGDLNGDGSPDLLLNNLICNGTSTTCANQARFWLNNGSGAFTSFNPTIN